MSNFKLLCTSDFVFQKNYDKFIILKDRLTGIVQEVNQFTLLDMIQERLQLNYKIIGFKEDEDIS